MQTYKKNIEIGSVPGTEFMQMMNFARLLFHCLLVC